MPAQGIRVKFAITRPELVPQTVRPMTVSNALPVEIMRGVA